VIDQETDRTDKSSTSRISRKRAVPAKRFLFKFACTKIHINRTFISSIQIPSLIQLTLSQSLASMMNRIFPCFFCLLFLLSSQTSAVFGSSRGARILAGDAGPSTDERLVGRPRASAMRPSRSYESIVNARQPSANVRIGSDSGLSARGSRGSMEDLLAFGKTSSGVVLSSPAGSVFSSSSHTLSVPGSSPDVRRAMGRVAAERRDRFPVPEPPSGAHSRFPVPEQDLTYSLGPSTSANEHRSTSPRLEDELWREREQAEKDYEKPSYLKDLFDEDEEDSDDDEDWIGPIDETQAKKLEQKAVERQYASWLVQGAYFESNYETGKSDPFENLKNLLSRRIPLDTIMNAAQDLPRLLLADEPTHRRILNFRGMLSSMVFYNTMFSNAMIHKAFTSVDLWNYHFTVPSLSFYLFSAGFVMRVMDAAKWLKEAGLQNAPLNLVAKFIVRENTLRTRERRQILESGDLRVLNSFPSEFQDFKVVLGTIDETNVIINSADDMEKQSGISPDFTLDLLNEVGSAIAVVDTVAPSTKQIITVCLRISDNYFNSA
jgi:hypothetical protein